MNWKEVEQRLRNASVEALRAFTRDHPAQTFYGFCFDCNAEYGEVGLSLNTEKDLCAYAARVYPSYSRREIEGDLRRSSGDGSTRPSTPTRPTRRPGKPRGAETQEAIHGAYIDDESAGVPERFQVSACRVLIAMEKDGGLEPIARAEGFKTLVSDHDETDADSWARLLRVRNRRR